MGHLVGPLPLTTASARASASEVKIVQTINDIPSQLPSVSAVSPLSIPGKTMRASAAQPADSIAVLLAETRIPRFKPKRHLAGSPSAPTTPPSSSISSRRSSLPRRADSISSIFDDVSDRADDPVGSIAASEADEAFAFLLDRPDTITAATSSLPELSRSFSDSTCADSDLSGSLSSSTAHTSRSSSFNLTAASARARNARAPRNSPPRESVNVSCDPLRSDSTDNIDDLDEATAPNNFVKISPSSQNFRNGGNSSGLARALGRRAKRRASLMVAALTSSLTSLATSLANAQHDDLISGGTMSGPLGLRNAGMLAHQQIPRPVSQQGCRSSSTTVQARIFGDAVEMERPFSSIVDERPPIELPSWTGRKQQASTKDDLIMPNRRTTDRPREPRLNADFLRVLVLETNMRRSGKLADLTGPSSSSTVGSGSGRARMILPPREHGRRKSRLAYQTPITIQVAVS
ncbi:Microtubule bundling protein [Savitreella phatthalungensis]